MLPRNREQLPRKAQRNQGEGNGVGFLSRTKEEKDRSLSSDWLISTKGLVGICGILLENL